MQISATTITAGVASVLGLMREHFESRDCDTPDPLAGRDADGLLALALLGVREVQARTEGQ